MFLLSYVQSTHMHSYENSSTEFKWTFLKRWKESHCENIHDDKCFCSYLYVQGTHMSIKCALLSLLWHHVGLFTLFANKLAKYSISFYKKMLCHFWAKIAFFVFYPASYNVVAVQKTLFAGNKGYTRGGNSWQYKKCHSWISPNMQ